MELLVIRHAIAEDRDEFAKSDQPDDERPLTDAGRRKMKNAARGLRKIVGNIDHLATSPLVRAVQTAEIISDAFDIGPAEVIPHLAPDARPEDFGRWISVHADKGVVAIVGHEPNLSSLVSWLIAGSGSSRIEMKKGGACLVSFDDDVDAHKGSLSWLMTPRILRELA
jgi:phosphohistidine phosphatase